MQISIHMTLPCPSSEAAFLGKPTWQSITSSSTKDGPKPSSFQAWAYLRHDPQWRL